MYNGRGQHSMGQIGHATEKEIKRQIGRLSSLIDQLSQIISVQNGWS